MRASQVAASIVVRCATRTDFALIINDRLNEQTLRRVSLSCPYFVLLIIIMQMLLSIWAHYVCVCVCAYRIISGTPVPSNSCRINRVPIIGSISLSLWGTYWHTHTHTNDNDLPLSSRMLYMRQLHTKRNLVLSLYLLCLLNLSTNKNTPTKNFNTHKQTDWRRNNGLIIEQGPVCCFVQSLILIASLVRSPARPSLIVIEQLLITSALPLPTKAANIQTKQRTTN